MLLSIFSSVLALGVFANGADHHSVDKARRDLQVIGTFAKVGQDLVGVPSSNEENVLFGTSVALSSGGGGNRLAVGAPMHDYNSTDVDELAIVDNGGGVFLYDFNGADWDLLWFLSGEAGEGLGERLSLSGDGATVAVRRERADPDATEVYSVSDDGTGELLGQPVSCGANGDTVTLSADGSRLAVSCENFSANTGLVEIFDFVAGSWVTIGTLTGSAPGDFFGWSTSFSNDGNRIAVSAPNYDGPINDLLEKRGLVRVFDYTNGVWTQVGDDILGPGTSDQLGFAMDLSGNGLSVITGSPGGDDGVINGSGLVNVFTEASGLWSQVSAPIAGTEEGDRFGRSVSISDDGSRLIASSFIHDVSRGHLRIFDLEGGNWIQYGSDIDGDNRADRFGNGRFSVSLTGDGARFASGSTGFDDVGRVRVFESDELVLTSIPTSTPTFEATAAPTLLPTLEPTTAPSLAPTSTQTLEPTVAVQTFEPTASSANQTVEPTVAIQTLEPTTGPTVPPTVDSTTTQTATPTNGESSVSTTLSAAPSPSPTLSATPSIAQTATPTLLLGKTDWDIDRVGSVSVQFDDSSSEQEIMLEFIIHRRDTLVRVFEEDCSTEVDDSVIGFTTLRAPVSGDKDALAIFLDIKQDGVTESPIFSEIDPETATINLCVRIDLLSSGDTMASVTFYDQKLFITVDMTADFSVTNIKLDRGSDSVDIDTSLEYTVTACQCNESFECAAEIITQASDALICLETNATDVEIDSILQLDFTQGSFSQNAIDNGEADDLTVVALIGKKLVVRTKLFSAFFGDLSPIDASGVCTLMFVDDNGPVRRLNAPVTIDRGLSDTNAKVAADSDFAVSFLLQSDDLEGGSGTDKTANMASFMVAAMAYGAFAFM